MAGHLDTVRAGELINGIARIPGPLIAASILLVPLTALICAIPYGYLLPLVILGITYVVWSYKRPEYVLGTIILLHILILERSESISVPEIVFGLYFFGFVAFWFVRELLIRDTRIVRSSLDGFLLAFLALCFVSIDLASSKDASALKGLREFLTIATFLLYFPGRDVMKKKNGRYIVLAAYVILTVVLAAKNLINYRSSLNAATYTWEILSGRKASNAHFFVATTIFSTALFATLRTWRTRILVFGLLLFSVLALFVSFTRGFWLGTLLGLGVLFILFEKEPRWRLVRIGLVVSLLSAGLVYAMGGEIGTSVLQSLLRRFTSSEGAFTDISFMNRIVESRAALAMFEKNPLVGNGFGATFHYFSLLTKTTFESWYIHNGYLFLLFKVGILGTVLFLGFVYNLLKQGLIVSRKLGSVPVLRAAVRSVLGIMAAFMLIALTSDMFIEKQSLLIFVLSASLISALFLESETDESLHAASDAGMLHHTEH